MSCAREKGEGESVCERERERERERSPNSPHRPEICDDVGPGEVFRLGLGSLLLLNSLKRCSGVLQTERAPVDSPLLWKEGCERVLCVKARHIVPVCKSRSISLPRCPWTCPGERA